MAYMRPSLKMRYLPASTEGCWNAPLLVRELGRFFPFSQGIAEMQRQLRPSPKTAGRAPHPRPKDCVLHMQKLRGNVYGSISTVLGARWSNPEPELPKKRLSKQPAHDVEIPYLSWLENCPLRSSLNSSATCCGFGRRVLPPRYDTPAGLAGSAGGGAC